MREFELQDCISKSRMALRNRLQKRTFSDTVVTDGWNFRAIISFNLQKLLDIAVNADDGAQSRTKVLKFVEGLHNKALLLTMNNGKEVFAKLPNPNAGPARCVTASEVATREFLSHPGSQFASTGTLSGLFQARTFGVVAEKIWDWIEDLRDDLTITPELWEKNEMAWVKGHASPRMNYYVSLKDPELHDQALTLLSKYLEPTPYLVPSEPEAAANVLWHPDLHLDNIFVDPTTCKITSIVDWQSTSIAPLFYKSCVPRMFRHDDPIREAWVVPSRPDNFNTLSMEEGTGVDQDLENETIHKYYEAMVYRRAPYHWKLIGAAERHSTQTQANMARDWSLGE
uniref:Altered inheritance of mitochondria protein 9, mitochondrial n=1 Tax=Coccidioides posadasii RMSCC 3488 TaxID=454284 RepID=A0A0J6FB11_COCPO|nr:hypothetical protein CPAG_02789 [Coccidioides posadasii RMSCC 3488]